MPHKSNVTCNLFSSFIGVVFRVSLLINDKWKAGKLIKKVEQIRKTCENKGT